MKKALASCVSAFTMSLWLLPIAAVAAAGADNRFLRRANIHAHELQLPVLPPPIAAALPPVLAVALVPAPMPAPAPGPAPAPDLPPPIPLCNWTFDWEGVARPAIITNMSDGNYTAGRGNMSFSDIEPMNPYTDCIPPPLQRCSNPVEDGKFARDHDDEGTEFKLYSLVGVDNNGSIKHGQEFEVVCGDDATPVDQRYPLEAWGQDWYPGTAKIRVLCNNGTILNTKPYAESGTYGYPDFKAAGLSPIGLRCAMKQKVTLTQDDVSYLRWTEPHFVTATSRGVKWIDTEAIQHRKLLMEAMNKSTNLESAARIHGELLEVASLKTIIQALIDNRMIPRGETLSKDTCKDLEKHWLYQLEISDPFKKAGNIGYSNWVKKNTEDSPRFAADVPLMKPVGLKCDYSTQKTAAGYDPYTRQMNYRYRDGCFCESQWTGGCPFRAELQPNFKTFGFDAIETKGITTAVGAGTTALCWYFSKPQHPEWGYLRSEEGKIYQAPGQNVTNLKTDYIALKKLAQEARRL